MPESPPKIREISIEEVFDLHKKNPLKGYKVSVVPSKFEFKDGEVEVQRGKTDFLGDFLDINESENRGSNDTTTYILNYKRDDNKIAYVTSATLDREHDSYKIILESPKSTHQPTKDSKSPKSRSKSRSKSPSNRGGRRRSKRSRKSRR
jgi:hypothetical protein